MTSSRIPHFSFTTLQPANYHKPLLLVTRLAVPSKPEIVKASNSSVKVKWTYRFHHDLPILTSMATPSVPSAYPLSFRVQYKEEMTGTWKSASEEIDLGKRSYEVRKLRMGQHLFILE